MSIFSHFNISRFNITHFSIISLIVFDAVLYGFIVLWRKQLFSNRKVGLIEYKILSHLCKGLLLTLLFFTLPLSEQKQFYPTNLYNTFMNNRDIFIPMQIISFIAYFIYAYALKNANLSYVVPASSILAIISTTILGSLYLKEIITKCQTIGLLLGCVSIVLLNK